MQALQLQKQVCVNICPCGGKTCVPKETGGLRPTDEGITFLQEK